MRMTLSADEYKTLVANIEQYDDEGHPYPHYSGRGMYGADCFGWVTNLGSGLVQLELARIWLKRRLHGASASDQDLDWVIDETAYAMNEIGSPSRDGMGHSTVFYWRGINVDGVSDDEEDDHGK